MKTINMISLARAEDRREAMIRQFSTVGLPYRIVDAVDGSKDIMDVEVDAHAYQKIYDKEIRAGEIGCYASHLKALNYIASSESDYGIVMEDDVVITEPQAEVINEMIQSTVEGCDSGWDLIYPGNPLMWIGHEYHGIDYANRMQRAINEAYSSSKPTRLRKALLGTQCYLISADFACFMLESWTTIFRPIDEVYRRLCETGRIRAYHAARCEWWCAPNFKVPSMIR